MSKSKDDLKFVVEDVDAPPPQIRQTKYGRVVEKLLAQTKTNWRAFRFKDEHVARRLATAAKKRIPTNVELRWAGNAVYMRAKKIKAR